MAFGDGAREFIERKKAAVIALVQNKAQEVEGYMKDHAPWTDRTGNARNGLMATTFVEQRGNTTRVMLHMGHSVEYGVHLEEAHASRWAIAKPTAERARNDLVREVPGVWEG